MFRTLPLTMAFCALTFTSAQSVSADIVYIAEDFTFTQAGWSFDGGTFTTNGFIGTVTPANVSTVFTAWDLTFTSPAATYTLTNANSTLSYPADPPATNLELTPTAIVWPNIANPGPGNDRMEITSTSFDQTITFSAADGTPNRGGHIT